MVIRKCDKCGKVIKNNFWKIKVFECEDDNGMHSTKGVAMNVENNIKAMFNREKEYCEKCINSIIEFINLDVKEEIN